MRLARRVSARNPAAAAARSPAKNLSRGSAPRFAASETAAATGPKQPKAEANKTLWELAEDQHRKAAMGAPGANAVNPSAGAETRAAQQAWKENLLWREIEKAQKEDGWRSRRALAAWIAGGAAFTGVAAFRAYSDRLERQRAWGPRGEVSRCVNELTEQTNALTLDSRRAEEAAGRVPIEELIARRQKGEAPTSTPQNEALWALELAVKGAGSSIPLIFGPSGCVAESRDALRDLVGRDSALFPGGFDRSAPLGGGRPDPVLPEHEVLEDKKNSNWRMKLARNRSAAAFRGSMAGQDFCLPQRLVALLDRDVTREAEFVAALKKEQGAGDGDGDGKNGGERGVAGWEPPRLPRDSVERRLGAVLTLLQLSRAGKSMEESGSAADFSAISGRAPRLAAAESDSDSGSAAQIPLPGNGFVRGVPVLTAVIGEEMQAGRVSAPLFLGAATLLVRWAEQYQRMEFPEEFSSAEERAAAAAERDLLASELEAAARVLETADETQPIAHLVASRLLRALDHVPMDAIADRALSAALDTMQLRPLVETSPESVLSETQWSVLYTTVVAGLASVYGQVRWMSQMKLVGMPPTVRSRVLKTKFVGRGVFAIMFIEVVTRFLMAMGEDPYFKFNVPHRADQKDYVLLDNPVGRYMRRVRERVGEDSLFSSASVSLPSASAAIMAGLGVFFVRRHKYIVAPLVLAMANGNREAVFQAYDRYISVHSESLPKASKLLDQKQEILDQLLRPSPPTNRRPSAEK
jgi:hypothetical protein